MLSIYNCCHWSFEHLKIQVEWRWTVKRCKGFWMCGDVCTRVILSLFLMLGLVLLFQVFLILQIMFPYHKNLQNWSKGKCILVLRKDNISISPTFYKSPFHAFCTALHGVLLWRHNYVSVLLVFLVPFLGADRCSFYFLLINNCSLGSWLILCFIFAIVRQKEQESNTKCF